MPNTIPYNATSIAKDLIAGLVVFLVAMPLCLGIALASGASPFAGLVSGIVGGIVVGLLSGSHTSVSGPAAGLTAIVAVQLNSLQDFKIFLVAVVIAGVAQVGLGALKTGFLSSFFPTSVIKGLLAAIGIILILKQLPHVLGHDTDPEGEMAFEQPDHQNTLTELLTVLSGDVQLGALVIGLFSIVLLVLWDRVPRLKKSILPAPLLIVTLGVILQAVFKNFGEPWALEESHMVQVPVAQSFAGFVGLFQTPDWSGLLLPATYAAGILIAVVASLETLINVEAVDRLDPHQRKSPTNRELIAQGTGNIVSGLLGGIPITSVIVRSSVNINAHAQSRISTLVHGVLLLVSVALLPGLMNMIPIASLAAILLVTGYKLANPQLFARMWKEGLNQFLPFVFTLLAIIFSDLIYGVLIGMGISIAFILHSNLKRPVTQSLEKHVGGEVLHLRLSNQVSFLNRASLESVLRKMKRGQHILLDARETDYIDPDILGLIKEFHQVTAPILGVKLSVQGFRDEYQLKDEIHFAEYSTKDIQAMMSPAQVLQMLQEGNARFRTGAILSRDRVRQLDASARGQNPLAVVLSCIDSRSPAEIIFDLGLGDVFSVRIAGNVVSPKILGSIEFGVGVAGAKLIVVLGHTKCGAINASVNLLQSKQTVLEMTGCEHFEPIVHDIQKSIDLNSRKQLESASSQWTSEYSDEVSRLNVLNSVRQIRELSGTVQRLIAEKKIAVVGAMYDVTSGIIEFFDQDIQAGNPS